MADKPTKKPMGLLKKAVLTGAIASGVGLGVGLKNEADVIKQHEVEPPPSAEVCAIDIANAEQHTKDLATGGAAFGALAALANAAAKKANENRANQAKKGRKVQLGDPNHVDHSHVKQHEEFKRQERDRNL